MKTLVITGGNSSERRISFMSAKQVKKGLEETGHKAKLFDLRKGKEELKKLAKGFDVIFPVLHGEEGEGGDLQKFLKTFKKPFVGGNWQGYKKGWYKIPFKKNCDKLDIPTADWKKVKSKTDILKFGFPAVLKASSGGSSREVVILKSEKDLKSPETKKLLKSKLDLLIERYIKGHEITVAILGNKALPVLEIVPPEGDWFDYQNKYWGKTKEIPFAPSVKKDIQKKAQQIALKIHQYFKLGQFSRTDFMVRGNEIYTLEVNTIPGLTASSLFPKAAQAVGITFPELLDKIVKMAYESKVFKNK